MAPQLTGTNGFVGAIALAVDQPRDELLAGAALARDEHRRRVPRHLGGDLERLRHGGDFAMISR
jgi:hypothetical protein